MDDAAPDARRLHRRDGAAARRRRLDRGGARSDRAPGAAPVALVSISSVHWSDGGALDIDAHRASAARPQGACPAGRCHARCRRAAASTCVALDPDFLSSRPTNGCSGPTAAPSCMSPSATRTACRWSRRLRSRAPCAAEQEIYFRDVAYRRRRAPLRHGRARPLHLDGDGRDRHGDDGGWGTRRVVARLAMLTERLADGPAQFRRDGPRPRCARRTSCACAFPGAWPDGLIERLAAENVHVAPRLGRLRISPHVYNDEEDVDRFVATFRRLVSGA